MIAVVVFLLLSLNLVATDEPPRSIYNILKCQDRFAPLVDAIKNFPEIVEALKGGKKDITLFAPNDDAFKKVGTLPSGEHLQRIVQYHLLTEIVTLKDGLNREIFMTLLTEPILGGPQRVKILKKKNDFYVNDRIKVIEKNIQASNGIIQVVDAVLLPPGDEFKQLAEEPTKASIYLAGMSLIDMDDILKKQRLTLFVPINEAFDHLPKGELHFLFSREGRGNLTRLLKRHIVPSIIYLGELEQNEVKLTTLEDGVTLLVQKRDSGGFFVNGIAVQTNDVFGKNGAINYVVGVVPKKPKVETGWIAAVRKTLKSIMDYIAGINK